MKFYLVISFLFVCLIGTLLWLVFTTDRKPQADKVSEFPTTEDLLTNRDIVPTAPSRITIKDKFGQGLNVPNITRNVYSPGSNTFILTGESPGADYVIAFYPEYDDFFQISLENEPLGEVRKAAEQNLVSILNLKEDELCRLNYSVRTNDEVSQFYSGQELGFSFCPGSVALE